MNNQQNDGGPAFPFGQISELTGQPINGYFAPGMSLLDLSAVAAMHAQIASGRPMNDYTIADSISFAGAFVKALSESKQETETEWPCQHLHGGRGSAIMDDDSGMCQHPDCKRPDLDWTQWHGGPCCPVSDGVIGDIVLRDGTRADKRILSEFHWEHGCGEGGGDIIAYRIGGKP